MTEKARIVTEDGDAVTVSSIEDLLSETDILNRRGVDYTVREPAPPDPGGGPVETYNGQEQH